MKTIYRLITGLALAAMVFGGAASPAPTQASGLAAGVKRLVDDDGFDCLTAPYTTINAAIADAGPGDTITVCDGNYEELLVIASKPGLKLIGMGMPRILAPLNTNGPIISVTNSLNVTIQGLAIEGNASFSPASTGMTGIAFGDSSGTISKNFISGIHRTPMDTLPQGDGILVYGTASPTPLTVKILNNTIYNFQHAGIWVQGTNKPTITRNLIQASSVMGNSPTGIMLKRLDGGSVDNNVIASDWSEALYGFTSTGIDMPDTSHVKIASNTIRAFQRAINLESVATQAIANTISGNRILDSLEGIRINGGGLVGTHNNVIKSNKIISAAYWLTFINFGVDLQAGGLATGNRITGNTIHGYAAPGFQDGGTGTVVSGNKWAMTAVPGS